MRVLPLTDLFLIPQATKTYSPSPKMLNVLLAPFKSPKLY